MATLWRDNLVVGVAEIDNEHKTLVKALDDLLAACATGQGRAHVAKTLDFVHEYTKTHFGHEEQLQMQYKYPDMNAHKRLHATYVANIVSLTKELEATGGGIIFVQKVTKTLGDWLLNHISTEDKKVGAHIQASRGK